MVDLTSSLSQPTSSDDQDMLIARDLSMIERADDWGLQRAIRLRRFAKSRAWQEALDRLLDAALNITSRPDILPTWLRAVNLTFADVKSGARYDHNYLALRAVMTGKCLLVAPEMLSATWCAEAFCIWYRDHGLAAACNIGPTRSTVVTILKSLGLFAGGSSVFPTRPPSSKPLDSA